MPLYGLWVGLASGLMWLLRGFSLTIAALLASFFGRAVLGALVLVLLSYFASTKIDALSWVLDQFQGEQLTGIAVSFSFLGTIIQALRIEDIFLVYINAYVTAWVFRTLMALGVMRGSNRGTLSA